MPCYLSSLTAKKIDGKLSGNGFGLGEGGLVGCSILAECFCPLLPNPCYVVVFFFIFCAVGVFFLIEYQTVRNKMKIIFEMCLQISKVCVSL